MDYIHAARVDVITEYQGAMVNEYNAILLELTFIIPSGHYVQDAATYAEWGVECEYACIVT